MKHSVVAIIFQNDRKEILCAKRRDVSLWVMPGGAVDPGETYEEAVVREVKEETGVDVKIVRKVGEYIPIQILSTVTHAYECVPVSGTPCITDEVQDVGYYPIDNLPHLFFHIHEGWIHEALENQPDVIKRDLTEVTYWKIFCFILKHPIHFFRFFFAKVEFKGK